jgi:hypothetical protein
MPTFEQNAKPRNRKGLRPPRGGPHPLLHSPLLLGQGGSSERTPNGTQPNGRGPNHREGATTSSFDDKNLFWHYPDDRGVLFLERPIPSHLALRVEPRAILNRNSAHATEYGLHFGPDAGTHARIEVRSGGFVKASLNFEFSGQRSHLDPGEATGNDRLEAREIKTHIQSEAMEGDPSPNPHTDRCNLAFVPGAPCASAPVNEDSRPTGNATGGYSKELER